VHSESGVSVRRTPATQRRKQQARSEKVVGGVTHLDPKAGPQKEEKKRKAKGGRGEEGQWKLLEDTAL